MSHALRSVYLHEHIIISLELIAMCAVEASECFFYFFLLVGLNRL